jgi:hypothetical protein
MLTVLRFIFPACFAWSLHVGSRLADVSRGTTTSSAELGYIALCLIFALASGIVWAPAIGARMAQPVTDIFVDTGEMPHETPTLLMARAAGERGFPRLAVLLCLFAGWLHPSWPGAFLMGLKYSAPRSWFERHFAAHVYQFENARNCWMALLILRQHGRDPGVHPQAEIARLIFLWEREPPTDISLPLPLVRASTPPAIQRNPAIKIPVISDGRSEDRPAGRGPEKSVVPSATHLQLP